MTSPKGPIDPPPGVEEFFNLIDPPEGSLKGKLTREAAKQLGRVALPLVVVALVGGGIYLASKE